MVGLQEEERGWWVYGVYAHGGVCNSDVWGVQQLLAGASLQSTRIEKRALICLVSSDVGCVVP